MNPWIEDNREKFVQIPRFWNFDRFLKSFQSGQEFVTKLIWACAMESTTLIFFFFAKNAIFLAEMMILYGLQILDHIEMKKTHFSMLF